MFQLTLIKLLTVNHSTTELILIGVAPMEEVSFKVRSLYWLSLLLNSRGGKFKVIIFLLTRVIIHRLADVARERILWRKICKAKIKPHFYRKLV